MNGELWVTVESDGAALRLGRGAGERRISAAWLFDHGEEARAASGQRGHGALAAGEAVILAAGIEGDRLVAQFPGARRTVRLSTLRARPAETAKSLWLTPAALETLAPIPFAAYLADDGALAQALARVERYGLVLMAGAGADEDAVERAVARFGYIRETNYGRLFDVRVEAEPANLAYTPAALDLHTDNPYRDPAPTVQLLHVLAADEAGGDSLFADGIAHAEALRREAPDDFDTLAGTPVRFTYRDATGARWSARKPVIELDAMGDPAVIRLNHRSLDLEPGDAGRQRAWYRAYLAFHRRLHAPEAMWVRRLAPGEMVIFDNRRVLHGRTAYRRTGARWLRGAYADADGLAATLARLSSTSEASSPS